MLNVASLGTCRVYDALNLLQSRSNLRVLPRFWGYPHTTKEVLQDVEWAQGKLNFPCNNLDIYNLVHLDTLYFGAGTRNTKQCIGQADIVFIEISSTKYYSDGKHYIQGNRLADSLGVHLFDLDRVLFKGGEDSLPKAKIDEIRTYQAGHLTAEEICKDLENILTILSDKTVVLTSNFTVSDHNEQHFSGRVLLRDVTRKCAEDARSKGAKVTYFDPSDLLRQNGMPIKDYSHYEDGFVEILAEQYEKLILETDVGSKKMRDRRTIDLLKYLKPGWILINGRHYLYQIKKSLFDKPLK